MKILYVEIQTYEATFNMSDEAYKTWQIYGDENLANVKQIFKLEFCYDRKCMLYAIDIRFYCNKKNVSKTKINKGNQHSTTFYQNTFKKKIFFKICLYELRMYRWSVAMY